MLVDPLDVVDAYLNQRAGRLAVATASLIIALLLWLIDSRALKIGPSYAKSGLQYRSKREMIHHYEAIVIHGCLRLFCLVAALLTLIYFVRAFLLER